MLYRRGNLAHEIRLTRLFKIITYVYSVFQYLSLTLLRNYDDSLK